MTARSALVCLLCAAAPLPAQDRYQEILARLDRLEQENRVLRAEVEQLRRDLAAPAPPERASRVEERLEVQEARTTELAQTRVQSSTRFPITITGMALFNVFSNGAYGGGAQYPTSASLQPGLSTAGGSFRQTILGFRFQGPEVAGGGKVSGSLYTDFWAGSESSLNHILRIRTATLSIDWKRTSITAGQDKPLISPREPESLAQVAVSPLTGAGNPWLWQPQVRLEHRIPFGDSSGLRAQAALYQTSETRTAIPDDYSSSVSPARPGYQGRLEWWRRSGNARMEIASGFHASSSRAAGVPVPSRIVSLDWMIRPAARLDFSGLFFAGQNIAPLGALRQGFVFSGALPRPVHTRGGYGQLAWRPLARLSFHIFSGQQDDRDSDLLPGRVGKNLLFGGNSMLRVAPNVVLSFEGATVRTHFIASGVRQVTHYDLGLAYFF